MTYDPAHGRPKATPAIWNWRSPAGTAVAALAAAVALYLFAWHWEHTVGVLPYLALLACPLMHLFMHRGHHHGPSRPQDAPDHDPR
jgi:hypothetical protein